MRSIHRFSFLFLILLVTVAGAEPRAGRFVAAGRAIEWQPADDPVAAVLSVQRPDAHSMRRECLGEDEPASAQR